MPPGPRLTIRELHEHIRDQVERAKGTRSWTELARTAGIATSTLSDQVTKPRFTVATLARISLALGVDIKRFLPSSLLPNEPSMLQAVSLLDEAENILARLRSQLDTLSDRS